MNCPQNWECSDECFYYVKFNKSCTYTEEEQVNLQEIADKIEKQDYEQTMKDAEALIKANEEREKLKEGTLEWFYSTHPPDYNVKEPINAMSGAIKFGGGSNSRVKKSKRGNKVRQDVWEGV